MKFGYARVSSKDQREDRQINALVEYGVEEHNIFVDKQSGKDFNREKYQTLLKVVQKDDIIVIKSLDRLGRNYKEMIRQWQYITQDINADIVVLDMELLDTTRHKDLLGTLISEIVLQLLSYVAESERANIKQRQAEGILAAKARGVAFGRRRRFFPENYIDTYVLYLNKKISMDSALEKIGCSKCLFYQMLSKLRKEGKIPPKKSKTL